MLKISQQPSSDVNDLVACVSILGTSLLSSLGHPCKISAAPRTKLVSGTGLNLPSPSPEWTGQEDLQLWLCDSGAFPIPADILLASFWAHYFSQIMRNISGHVHSIIISQHPPHARLLYCREARAGICMQLNRAGVGHTSQGECHEVQAIVGAVLPWVSREAPCLEHEAQMSSSPPPRGKGRDGPTERKGFA